MSKQTSQSCHQHFQLPQTGLTNGSQGKVHYILYRTGEAPPALPAAVVCTFDSYSGPDFIPGLPKSVPVTPLAKDWFQHRTPCQRRMLPLILGYALSIHKLQGSTCQRVILNAGPKVGKPWKEKHCLFFNTFPSLTQEFASGEEFLWKEEHHGTLFRNTVGAAKYIKSSFNLPLRY